MMVGFLMIVVECDEMCIDFCLKICYVDKKVMMFDEVFVMIDEVKCIGKLVLIGLFGNVVDVFLEFVKCGIMLDCVID